MITSKPIALASDHAGLPLKEELKKHFDKEKIPYIDYGTDSTASVDYPDYAHLLCLSLQEGKHDLGILICGTGVGMSMVANKHEGIRAACLSDAFSCKYTRLHNNANVLCMGARVVGPGLAAELADLFISTEFEGGRHERRVNLLNSYDLKNKQ